MLPRYSALRDVSRGRGCEPPVELARVLWTLCASCVATAARGGRVVRQELLRRDAAEAVGSTLCALCGEARTKARTDTTNKERQAVEVPGLLEVPVGIAVHRQNHQRSSAAHGDQGLGLLGTTAPVPLSLAALSTSSSPSLSSATCFVLEMDFEVRSLEMISSEDRTSVSIDSRDAFCTSLRSATTRSFLRCIVAFGSARPWLECR